MLLRQQKKQIVKNLALDLSGAKAVVFSDYQSLKAGDAQKLRADLKREGAVHKVIKITLLKKALARAGIDTGGFNFQVPLAVTYSATDEVVPAKILSVFAKSNESLKLLGGVLNGRMIDLNQVKVLAGLGSKQELRGRVVAAVAGPLRGLVGVLSGNIRSLIYALSAISKIKN